MVGSNPIELTDHARKEAIASIRRYFQQNLPDEIGDLSAGLLLDFFLEDIAPTVYNKAGVEAHAGPHQRCGRRTVPRPVPVLSRLEQRRKKSAAEALARALQGMISAWPRRTHSPLILTSRQCSNDLQLSS